MRFTLSATVSALALLASSVHALPAQQTQAYAPAGNLDKLAKLMPKSALPGPDGLRLKYVLLGVGTQNYTCATGDENAAPGTTGATANLYDIGTRLNNDPFAKWTIPSISPLALSLSSQPTRFTQNLQSLGFEHLVGHHFFSGAAPVFALDQLSLSPYPLTVLGKLNETDAPTSSCPGTNAEGAIKWLLLKDTKGLSQGGINTVYRIETAGGNKPATCKGRKAAFEVKYSAQYWIFGPKSSGYSVPN
ncbi:uncharacterized protein EKO05_0010344 [Ascochyta rabiei]|uniref:Uncharacterized protein n=1 Tax=Didymella rabiei TaxID=5454 RepID=A0A162WGQ6_DIDRA|nr:uncharacterized protein EKO05_0010344 [Ascochyta rabiei]KZM19016.1 hypothetical protein ST47_g9857 [Ascochyta rabiei]UPX20099.1 hypothetical protein EKO05_0010344 [Ascochyta rabiei]